MSPATSAGSTSSGPGHPVTRPRNTSEAKKFAPQPMARRELLTRRRLCYEQQTRSCVQQGRPRLMTLEQGQIFVILIASMGLFIWVHCRHDVVSLGALLACVIAGLVPEREAFAGFGHPAVITVACVLVLSHGL